MAWRTARGLALAAAGLVISALWLAPDFALRTLWGAIVPALPASFLVHPGLWRNVCPIATLNMLAGRRSRGWRLSPASSMRIGTVGIASFFALVPARHFLFNLNGLATAGTIALFAVLALTLGALFDRKAGFCNAICPMLAVERLYGQAPLLGVSNPRCDGCSLCTARGCIDLASRKSIPQIFGRARHSPAWLGRPFGIFAAAFPGFVLGYFLAPEKGGAGSTYLTVAGWAAASYALTLVLSLAVRVPARAAIAGLATSAVLLFYWFAGEDVSRTWGWGSGGTIVIRLATAGLVAIWIWRFNRR